MSTSSPVQGPLYAENDIPVVQFARGYYSKYPVYDGGGQVFNVKSYGVKGDGVTDDTTTLNVALLACHTLGGGTVFVPYAASYLISAPLVIYSNTYLLIAPGTTITLKSGSNCQMLWDFSHSVNAQAVPSVMANITVDGGNWNRGSNGSQNNNKDHSIILGGNNVEVKNAKFSSTAGKYSVLFQNAVNFRAKNLAMNATASDGIHIQGPSSLGHIEDITGSTGDDFISITPNDYPQFVWGNEGDITDVVINNLILVNQHASDVVKILSGSLNSGVTPLNTKRIKIDNITGTCTSGSGNLVVFIGDDIAFTNTSQGNIDEIMIGDINCSLPSGMTVCQIGTNLSSSPLTIGKVIFRGIMFSNDINSYLVIYKPVTELMVERVQGSTLTTPPASIIALPGSQATISRLFLSNMDIVYGGSRGNSIIEGFTCTIGSIFMSNCYFSNMNQIANIGATTTNVHMTNVRCEGNANIFALQDAGHITVIGASGFLSDATSNFFANTNSSIESKTLDFPTDITNARLAVAKGDMCYNTSSAGIGIGPAVYSGSAWVTLT